MMSAFPRCRQYFIILSVAVLTACSVGESFETNVAKGKAALEKKDSEAAIILFKNAAQKNPDNGEVRYFLAQAYIDTGDFLSAEKELRHAKQLKFNPAQTQVALSSALLGQAKHRELLDEIQADPSYPAPQLAEILALRGIAYMGIAEHAEARSQFQRALQLDPKSARADLGLVQVWIAEKNTPQAQAANNQILIKHPRFAPAWLVQGDLLRAQSKPQQALAAYSKAIELEPRYFVAHIKLVSLLVDTQQLPQAQQQLNQVKKIAPYHPLTQHLQAHLHYLQRDYRGAEEAIQNALKVDGAYTPSLLLAGAIAQAKGADQQAETYFLKVLSEYPDHLYARKLLAAVQIKTGKMQNALTTLNPALSAKEPDSGVLYLAGEAHMASGEYAKASEYFTKAAALVPKNALIRARLGASWLAVGDAERGLIELESAAKLNPGEYNADISLIVNHLAKKEYDNALLRISELKKKEAANPITLNLEGQAYAAKNDFANAKKSFEGALALQPGNSVATLNLAQLELKEKNPQAARKHLESIHSKDPNNLQAILGLAEVALNAGDEPGYVNWLTRAIKSHPNILQPRTLLAGYYFKKKDLQKALTVARDAQAANPNNPDALGFLGAMQFAAGQTENALATMRLNPNMNMSHAIMALNYLRDGDPEQALKSARLLQEKQPRSPDGYTLAGVAYAQKKQYREAKAAFTKALSLAPGDPNATANLAVIALQEGNSAEARQLREGVLKKYPDHLESILALTDLDLKDGKADVAEQRLKSALTSSVESLPLKHALGKVYLAQGKPKMVLDLIEKLPGDQAKDPSILELAGAAQLRMGKPDLAVKALEAAAQNRPNIASTYLQLGLAYEQLNDLARANQSLQTAIKLEPELRSAQLAAARLMVKTGKGDPATNLKKLSEENPNDPALMLLRGDLALQQNRPKEAIPIYKAALAKGESNLVTVRLAAAQLRASDKQGATTTLQNWLKRHPEDVYIRNALAETLLGLGQHQEAVTHLSKLAEVQPNNVGVINNLAWALLETGSVDNAWVQAQRAYQLSPEQPQVLDTYAMVLLRKGKAAEAREKLQIATTKAPADAAIQVHLAQAFIADGQPANARKQLTTLLSRKDAFSQRAQAEELLKKLK